MSHSSLEPELASISVPPGTSFCFPGNHPTLLVFAFRDGLEEPLYLIN